MKRIAALVVASSILAGWTGCGVHISSNSWSDGDMTAVTNSTQTAEIPPTLKSVEVDNCVGSIHVTGADAGPMHWTWKLTVHARTDAVAQEIAQGVNCKTESDGDRIKLIVTAPDTSEPHRIESDFDIIVPKAAGALTKTHFGRTEISGLAGDVEAADQNGPIELHNISGHVRARTSFDRLLVTDTGPAVLKDQNSEIQATRIGGPLEAETSFGPLIVEDIAGPASLHNQNGVIKVANVRGDLAAKTSFDSIHAHDIHGTAGLTNQNGEIEAIGIADSLTARTSFGSLVARDIGGAVYLRNQNGRVQVAQSKKGADIKTSFDQISLDGIEGDAILENQNGGISANGVTGSVRAHTSFGSLEIKGGGPEFICHNQNGAIRIRATSTAVTNIEARTSFDSMEVHLPSGIQPVIQAHTSFGDVESDFPVMLNSRHDDGLAEASPNALHANLQNQNGNIRILRD